MSTTYMLRKPLRILDVVQKSGWSYKRQYDADFVTNGEDFAEVHMDEAGIVDGFTRYGQNRVSDLRKALDAVSEHDYEDRDYNKLFAE